MQDQEESERKRYKKTLENFIEFLYIIYFLSAFPVFPALHIGVEHPFVPINILFNKSIHKKTI